jgi:hypothetical protein
MSYDQVFNEAQQTMSMARTLAASSVSATNTLVAQAVSTMTAYQPLYPQDPITFSEAGISLSQGGFSQDQNPPGFPSIRQAQEVHMGALGAIDTLDDTFVGQQPNINLPAFNYSPVTPLAPLSVTAPTIDMSGLAVPDMPDIEEPALPTLLPLRTDLASPTLSLPNVAIQLPQRPRYNLTDSFAQQFAVGKTQVPAMDTYGNELLTRFFPGWQALIQHLYSRMNGILDGTRTALPERFDEQTYESLRTRANATYDQAIWQLNEASRATGWEMPGAARAAGTLRLQQERQQALNAAALEVYAKRTERELQHLQFIMGQALSLHQAATGLFSSAFGMAMESFKGAMDYGDKGMRYAIEVYRALQTDLQIDQGFVEKEIAILHEQREGEFSKLRIMEGELKIEELKTEQNKTLLEQYRSQIEAGNLRLERYDRKIKALQQTIDMRKLPLDVFKMNIDGYLASWSAKKGEYEQLDSLIRGDEAKTRGEMAKLDVYKTEASVFETVVGAKSKRIDAQIKRNEQISREFEARLDEQVKLTQIDASVADHALSTYRAMAEIFLAESKERLEEARFAFEKTIDDKKLKLEQRRFDLDHAIKVLEVELTRIKATAEVAISAAHVQGQQASAALGVMNTMTGIEAQVSA